MSRHYRVCTNISKKERLFLRAYNRMDWSDVPVRRIDRMIEGLQRIRQNHERHHSSPNRYQSNLDYSSSEYEPDSPDEDTDSDQSTQLTPKRAKRSRTESVNESNQEMDGRSSDSNTYGSPRNRQVYREDDDTTNRRDYPVTDPTNRRDYPVTKEHESQRGRYDSEHEENSN